MFNPYTMPGPCTHSKLSWEFSIWCNGNPIITIVLGWIPPDTSNPVYQMGNSPEMFYLVQPPATLYQMGNSQESFNLVQNKIPNFLLAVQSLPRTKHGGLQADLFGGLGAATPPEKNKKYGRPKLSVAMQCHADRVGTI